MPIISLWCKKRGSLFAFIADISSSDTGEKGAAGCTKFDAILSAAGQMGKLLDAGFTTVRDMSVFSPALKRAQQAGIVRGPKVIAGGRMISPTGGHGDLMPQLTPVEQKRLNTISCIADGVQECLQTVREQFRDGAEFIKICATGGVSSQVDGLDDVQFSDDEIRVMAEEADRHGSYVAAHCSNARGTAHALRNGVRCIEHGIELNDECIELMLK